MKRASRLFSHRHRRRNRGRPQARLSPPRPPPPPPPPPKQSYLRSYVADHGDRRSCLFVCLSTEYFSIIQPIILAIYVPS